MSPTRIVLAALAVPAAFGAIAHAQGGVDAPPAEPAPPPAPPAPTPKLVVGTPSPGTNVREGQDGRYTLGGRWYFRQDDANVGLSQRFFARRGLAGWTPKGVPHNWNAKDYTENRGSVGWYRKEFRLPARLCAKPREKKRRKAAAAPRVCDRYRWRVRFLGANHHATVWLNGQPLGSHSGGYFPFELGLNGLRPGRNTLVVRVSTLRSPLDLTHWRASSSGTGTGGWWNFGGLQREVWLRRIDGLDVEALRVLPRLPNLKGPARVETLTRVQSFAPERQRVRLSLLVASGKRRRTIDAGEYVMNPGGERQVRTRFAIPKPRLWRPRKGGLYRIAAVAEGEGGRSVYRAAFGVRQIRKLGNGTVLLNGHALRVRGASIHEDDPTVGSAWRTPQRKRTLAELRRLGATITRAHYPLHPAMMEMLDRAGVLFWMQAPVYQLTNDQLNRPRVRRSAVEANRATVEANLNHPSIITWSIANELGSEPSELGGVGPGHAAFINEALRTIRRLDDTRLIAIDRHSRLGEQVFHPTLAGLDALGINEYFGWYNAAAPGLPYSRTEDLLPWLDEVHKAFPHTALFITEYGAESSRDGPVEEHGTYDFQTKWVTEHALLHSSRDYINGSIVWALKDFRVHPSWGGGNWVPAPPWNNKGVIHEEGSLKPVFYPLAALFRRTTQFK